MASVNQEEDWQRERRLEQEYARVLKEREEVSLRRARLVGTSAESSVTNETRVQKLDRERWNMHRELERLGKELGWPDAENRVLRDVIAHHYSFGEKTAVPGTFVVSSDTQVSSRLDLGEAPGNLTKTYVEGPWRDTDPNDLVLVYDTITKTGGHQRDTETRTESVLHGEKVRRMEAFVNYLSGLKPPLDVTSIQWENMRDGVAHAYDNLTLFGIRVPAPLFPRFMLELQSHLREFWFEGKEEPYLETVTVSDRFVGLGGVFLEDRYVAKPRDLPDESDAVIDALDRVREHGALAEAGRLPGWQAFLDEGGMRWASRGIARRTTTVHGLEVSRAEKTWHVSGYYSKDRADKNYTDEQLLGEVNRMLERFDREHAGEMAREKEEPTNWRDMPPERSHNRR